MSVNLVNGDTLNSDFTAICNAIRAKTGGSGTIAYAPGDTSAITSAIASIPSGGGGVTPTFTETVICDNSAEGNTLTFTDDYTNYDLLLFEVYNTSTLKTSYMLTIPEVISHIRTISSNDINFNEFGNNQYVCYAVTSPAISIRTWTKYSGRNLVVKKVTGLTCSNATVTKTTFYERADRTTTAVTVEPAEDLADYDYIFLASSTNSYDETQPCFPPIKVDKAFFDETPFYRGSFFKYNDTYGLTSGTTIGHHSIDCVSNQQSGNYYLMCAYGLKFE
jgi:hypothetical protein